MVHFTKDVSLGHVIQVAVILFGILAFGLRLEGKLQILELRQQLQQRQIELIQDQLAKDIDEIKQTLRRIWDQKEDRTEPKRSGEGAPPL